MAKIWAKLVTSPDEIRAHLRKRWVVFGKEEGYLPEHTLPVAMEFDHDDGRPSARHFIVLAREGGREASVIGAGRLLLPDANLARARGHRYGLPLEERLNIDLSAIASERAVGEVGRICVERSWQGTTALAELCATMCAESLGLGVDTWISAANMECDSFTEACLVRGAIERQGLYRRDLSARSRVANEPRQLGRFHFFTDDERRRALSGDRADRLRLPRAVAADARLGARYVGEPLWDPYFGMYAMPLIASVLDVQRATERLRRARRRDQAA